MFLNIWNYFGFDKRIVQGLHGLPGLVLYPVGEDAFPALQNGNVGIALLQLGSGIIPANHATPAPSVWHAL